jgi:hypothetical protein
MSSLKIMEKAVLEEVLLGFLEVLDGQGVVVDSEDSAAVHLEVVGHLVRGRIGIYG